MLTFETLWRLAIPLAAVAFGSLAGGCQSGEDFSALKQEADDAYVRVPVAMIDEEFVRDTGFRRDHMRDDHYAVGWMPRRVYEDFGPGINIVELDEQLLARVPFDLATLSPREDLLPPAPEDFEDYHDYEALTTELEDLADEYPDLTELFSAGTSASGRELWVMRVSDEIEGETTDAHEPKLLYIANMHGDETVGRELMIYLLRDMLSGYEHNERIRDLVNHAEIFVMPSMNPDGFERGRRSNANGYDLNRNFPDFTTDPDDTPDGRQPETQAVMALHDDHHFVTALNYHGGEICFNMPWDTKSNRDPAGRFGDDPLMRQLARNYADANESMRNSGWDDGVTYGYEWYEVDGGLQDWSSYYRRSFHATIELSNTKYPNASSLPGYWEENKESLIAYLESSLFGLHLRVVDADGEAIARPTIRVIGASSRDVLYDTAFINKPTLPGAQEFVLSAEGYQPRTLTMEAWAFDGEFVEVALDE